MKFLLYISLIAQVCNIAIAQNPLVIPDTLSGMSFNLDLQTGTKTFYPNTSTSTFGVNGNFLGPTLILQQGNQVTIEVKNSLSEPTTIHWHGLHVSSPNDGGPHTVIQAGTTWSPAFTVLDHAATYWYHPHLHEKTAEHTTKGIGGFIIVRDPIERAITLPRAYGIDDFPLVIQSRAFDANKQFITDSPLDSVMLVNGTLNPYLQVPAQVVRLRLLNGSTQRVYNLGLESNLIFHQIATDGGLLDAPVSLTRLQLAPGERAEVLIDLSGKQGQQIRLMSYGSELQRGIYGSSNPSVMPMGSIPGYSNNQLNDNDFQLIRLDVVGPTTSPVTTIPSALIQNAPYLPNNSNATRNLTFSPDQMGPIGMVNGPFLINNSSFDFNVINYQIPINNTEIWRLTNMTGIAHPFHIHDVQFYVLTINGSPPPANMQGRKDVVMVPALQTVEFITRFEDFANDTLPYMYHCHMLNHEDEGMMGQFVVIGNSTNVDDPEEDLASPISVFPNPSKGVIHIQSSAPGENIKSIELYDYSGRLLLFESPDAHSFTLDLSPFGLNLLLLKIQTEKTAIWEKIINLK